MATRVYTLGGLRVLRDGVELTSIPGQPLRAALLVYLAVERKVSRDALLALFWPESDAESARHALRQALYNLRRSLGENWIQSHPVELRLSPDVACDVHEFDASAEQGDWSAAVSLYQGPFLGGVHLLPLHAWEMWVESKRVRLARSFRKCCRAWVADCAGGSDTSAAVEAARRWVTADPFDDEGQHTLIELLIDGGHRTEAIRQFDQYERLLEAEGLTPLDSTRALIDVVRSPEPPSHAAAPRQSTSPIPSFDPQAPRSTTHESYTVSTPPTSVRRGPRLWRGAGLGAVILVGSYIAVSQTETYPDFAGAPAVLTTLQGYESQPDLSPDGDRVVFTWAEDLVQNRRIMLVPSLGGTPVPVTDGESDDSYPVWSPDGQRIAFLRRNAATGMSDIMTIPVHGGSVTRLASVPWGVGLDWSPDGEWLAFADLTEAPVQTRIFVMSAATGEKRQLTRDTSSRRLTFDTDPSISPDGRHVAFLRRPLNGGASAQVYVQALGDSIAALQRTEEAVLWDVDWAADATGLLVAAGLPSDRYLIWLPRTGEPARRLAAGTNASHVSVSARAGSLVYTEDYQDHDIWWAPGPLASDSGPPRPLIRSTRDELMPSYSPDGKQVAFISARNGSWDVHVADADGTRVRQLTNIGNCLFPQWSPKGDEIVFHSIQPQDGEMVSDIFVVDTAGGFPRNITLDPWSDAIPSWSADGQFIYFQSQPDSSNWQLFRTPPSVPSKERVLVTDGLILRPLASDNGDIFYVHRGQIWVKPATGDIPRAVMPLGAGWTFSKWTLWNDRIAHFRHDGTATAIELFDPYTGETRQIASLDNVLRPSTRDDPNTAMRSMMALSISPDGKSIAYLATRAGSDLFHWRDIWPERDR